MDRKPISELHIVLGVLATFAGIAMAITDGFSGMFSPRLPIWIRLPLGFGGVVLATYFVLALIIGLIEMAVSRFRSAWTQDRRLVFIVIYCVLIALILLVVPWRSYYNDWEGYSFIFSPPSSGATIEYGKVILEFLCITAIFAIPFIISKWKRD